MLMDLSEGQIKKIAEIISSRLGPDASQSRIKSLAARVIDEMTRGGIEAKEIQWSARPVSTQISRSLVVNALGQDKEGLGEKLKSFVDGRALRLTAISDTKLESLRSVVAIIDCANYAADLNRLKFELSALCEEAGFKAIVQDGGYYGAF
ncbi:MAG: hypothetical protein A2W25_06490 [candidate division Zixibacteria bacterium RBG_16_53_22]|nr:MAG: hypothetical protein A2W25_06490 [candidate division Zixibacteria bacterium RBG_16_53_22]